MSEHEYEIILGPEYDQTLRDAVAATLRELGARKLNDEWGVAGSQEIYTLTVELGGKTILIEAETYMGLSLRGDRGLIEDIAVRVRKRISRQR